MARQDRWTLPPVAFMSYARFNDQHDRGYLSQLREHLAGEVSTLLGETFAIFQDRTDILWGQEWRHRIDQAIDASTFLITILTPHFFRSEECRAELEHFLERERVLRRNDLILPIYYVDVPALSNAKHPDHLPVMRTVAARQLADWRKLRFEPFTSPHVLKMLASLARQIVAALERTAEDGAKAFMSRPEPPTHVVDAMYRGDFPTISAAIAAARPGDRILVRRGYYQEELIIDKPLEIVGDGTLGDVVVEAQGKNAILFQATIGRVANLVLRQRGGGNWFGVDICQGRLDLEDCDISSDSLACVAIHNGAAPVLRRNRIHDGKAGGVFVWENGRGTLEDNDIFANAHAGVIISEAAVPVLRGNRINRNGYQAIWIYESGGGIFENNDLTANARGAWNISADSVDKVKHVCNKDGTYETDISGVWEGVAKFGSNRANQWLDLYIKQSGSSITGTLVSVNLFKGYPTVIRQKIRGAIEGKNIIFSGTSYSFLRIGETSTYNTDSITGEFTSGCTEIRAHISDINQITGNVTLKLAKSESYLSLDISGVWIGTSESEDGTEELIVCLKKSGDALNGVMYISYHTGKIFKKHTLVRQDVVGKLDGRKLLLKGTSYSVIEGDVNKWLLDHISAEVDKNGKNMEGVKFDDKEPNTGTVVLKLGRVISTS